MDIGFTIADKTNNRLIKEIGIFDFYVQSLFGNSVESFTFRRKGRQ